jgi:hypothetical protein
MNFSQLISVELNTENDDLRSCIISSREATEPIKLNENDIYFIQECIYNEDQLKGELDVIVNEGLIRVQWEVKI